ncbi:MAG: glycosyltransferase family 4 protein [Propionibacteriaceae bacterium]|nr:glycosyltransferase family 4 protein [Propionibacteriaceae bacterium]
MTAQQVEFPLAVLDEYLASSPDFVVLTPAYPRSWATGGEFIRTRVLAYAAAGLNGFVVHYSPNVDADDVRAVESGIPLVRVPTQLLPAVVEALGRTDAAIVCHSPVPELQHLLLDELPGRPVGAWFHGYEVRDTRRLHGNVSMGEAAQIREAHTAVNASRFEAAGRLFANPHVTKVFVSDFQRRTSETDVGTAVENFEVIPNFIDGEFFAARVRQPAEANRILLMRGFAQRNYGNDIALQAISHLSRREGFADLHFTIRGFGRLFDGETARVAALPNVDIHRRYSSPAEMAIAHYEHGVFLCPSRYDTQGVMLGEAMASGMACITNPVAAIPEFTDEASVVFAKPDDPWAFAEALWYLVHHPELLPQLSTEAARRVREQCGHANTIGREISLIERLRP